MRKHSYENDFDLHENGTGCRTRFYVKGFALRLVLKQKPMRSRKYPIGLGGLEAVMDCQPCNACALKRGAQFVLGFAMLNYSCCVCVLIQPNRTIFETIGGFLTCDEDGID